VPFQRLPKLSELKDGEKAALQTEVNYEAILKAERIIRQIDLRWSGDRIPGKS
jgi:hypothetical protein